VVLPELRPRTERVPVELEDTFHTKPSQLLSRLCMRARTPSPTAPPLDFVRDDICPQRRTKRCASGEDSYPPSAESLLRDHAPSRHVKLVPACWPQVKEVQVVVSIAFSTLARTGVRRLSRDSAAQSPFSAFRLRLRRTSTNAAKVSKPQDWAALASAHFHPTTHSQERRR
jgi:hypothetical protein